MEKQKKEPLKLNNLADLRRTIQLGTELKALSHSNHPGIVGLVRVVTKVQTNGFYSKIKDQPEHEFSQCNWGQGFYSPFEKAARYEFDGSSFRVLDARENDGSILYEMEVYSKDNTMGESLKSDEKMSCGSMEDRLQNAELDIKADIDVPDESQQDDTIQFMQMGGM